MTKISANGGLLEVVYIATSREVSLVVEAPEGVTYRDVRGDMHVFSGRLRLTLPVLEARKLGLEIERVLREDV